MTKKKSRHSANAGKSCFLTFGNCRKIVFFAFYSAKCKENHGKPLLFFAFGNCAERIFQELLWRFFGEFLVFPGMTSARQPRHT